MEKSASRSAMTGLIRFRDFGADPSVGIKKLQHNRCLVDKKTKRSNESIDRSNAVVLS